MSNYDFDRDTEKYRRNTGEAYLGKIEYDADARKYNLAGKSLLELPENLPTPSSDGMVKG